eukprot:COSAG02_NODE_13283_length_1416_cov_0.952164_3_plen_33_part_01
MLLHCAWLSEQVRDAPVEVATKMRDSLKGELSV